MKKNCFGNNNGECAVLTVGPCMDARKCAFFKTPQQFEKDLLESYKRLASLPPEYQRHIADTYYRGEQPWRSPQEAQG
jgi:hypothetical protein